MNNGRYCDNCEEPLHDEDYVSYGSWSYTCHSCGFIYHHGMDVERQITWHNQRKRAQQPAQESPIEGKKEE